jgi:hypothetical protein
VPIVSTSSLLPTLMPAVLATLRFASPGLAGGNSGVGAPAAVPRLLMMKLSRSPPLRVPIRNGVLLVALVAFEVTCTVVSPTFAGAASVL